jgi:hypothetical protein
VFQNCTSLTKVNINDNITEIKSNAFQGCTGLSSVSISTESKLKKINSSVFKGCTSLTNLYLPDSLTTLGDSAFEGCTSFEGNTTVIMPGVSGYGLKIPKNITSIGSLCFKNSNIVLLGIENESKLEKISNSAFQDCQRLIFILLSNAKKLTEIGSKSFYNCPSLCGYDKTLLLPDSLQTIGDEAFYGCMNVQKLSLPSSLKKLGNLCLATGTSSTKITINKELSTPPVFTLKGYDDKTSLPLGNPAASDSSTTIPKLSIHIDVVSKYTNNDYWKKYYSWISSFNDAVNDDTNTGGDNTPETPTIQKMGITFYNSNYVPSNVQCEVTSTAGFVGVINSSTPVSEGTSAFGIQSETNSIIFTITLTVTGDANKSAEITFKNLNGMSADTSSLTIHADSTSTNNTWIGVGKITVSRSSTSVSAGGRITIKIN